jgi:hypothetical protein
MDMFELLSEHVCIADLIESRINIDTSVAWGQNEFSYFKETVNTVRYVKWGSYSNFPWDNGQPTTSRVLKQHGPNVVSNRADISSGIRRRWDETELLPG